MAARGKHAASPSRGSTHPVAGQQRRSSEDYDYQLRRLYMQSSELSDSSKVEEGELKYDAEPAEQPQRRPQQSRSASAGRAQRPGPQRTPARAPEGQRIPREPAEEVLPGGKAAAPKSRGMLIVARVLAVFLVTVLMIVLFLLLVMGVVTKGPSEQAMKMFVFSTQETSAIKFLPGWYLSDEELDAVMNPPVVETPPDTYRELGFESAGENGEESEEGTSLVQVDETAAAKELQIVDIQGSTFRGKMMIIPDPRKVKIASLDFFGEYGIQVTDFIEKYSAIGGTNAGGFYDLNGQGNGGTPDGLVIQDGAIKFGSPYSAYIGVMGFDADYVLHVGDMTGQQALDCGIVSGMSFASGPTLIKDGVKQSFVAVSANPRTCMGQCPDGSILLMVTEGRQMSSIGASFDDLADTLMKYGAVNAVNLDGGSSSVMYYQGEMIVKGNGLKDNLRPVPTAILVLP